MWLCFRAGVVIFVCFVLVEKYTKPSRISPEVEPYGFALFLCCLG